MMVLLVIDEDLNCYHYHRRILLWGFYSLFDSGDPFYDAPLEVFLFLLLHITMYVPTTNITNCIGLSLSFDTHCSGMHGYYRRVRIYSMYVMRIKFTYTVCSV